MAESNGQYSLLDFEKPIIELERKLQELENFSHKTNVDLGDEISRLRERSDTLKREIFARLTPWQRVQLAREPSRPDALDYMAMLFTDIIELHGDKCFGDDKSIFTGLVRFEGRRLMLVAQRKGRNTKERMAFNFGSPHPEGYRKALEKMKLAEKFGLPIVTMINTPGAYPGIGAEERGQAQSIAQNLLELAALRTPVVSIVIGEGGSGGALGICIADRFAILENAYFSVISPEACAAILWRDSTKAPQAAELLRLVPRDLAAFGIVDDVIPEPLGGAHRNHAQVGEILKRYLVETLNQLCATPVDILLRRRYAKYRRIGSYAEWAVPKEAESLFVSPAMEPSGSEP